MELEVVRCDGDVGKNCCVGDVGKNCCVEDLWGTIVDDGCGVVLSGQSDSTFTVAFKALQFRFGFPRRSMRPRRGIALIIFMMSTFDKLLYCKSRTILYSYLYSYIFI